MEINMATEKTTAKHDAEEIARRIWLAGVGAYGRMFEEAQDRVTKATGSANDLFDQLVARGEVLEGVVRERIAGNEAVQKVAGAVDKLQDFRDTQRSALMTRMETVRKAVDHAVTPFNPLAIGRTLQDIEARLARLEAAQAPAARPAARKVAAAKTTGKSVARKTRATAKRRAKA
jgi:hypothetical protein